MKCRIFMAIFSCLLNTSLPLAVPRSPKEVHNNLFAYLSGTAKKMSVLMQDSPCYEVFYPLFYNLTDQAKEQAATCQTNAFSKLQILTQIKNEEFKETVENIKSPLESCGAVSDLGYFQCMTDIADEVDSYFKKIEEMYAEFIKIHAVEMKKINYEHLICLGEVLEQVERENAKIYENLKKCTTMGQCPTSSPPNYHISNDDEDKDYVIDSEEMMGGIEYPQNRSTPIVVGLSLVGIGIAFCIIFIGIVQYKTKKTHGQVVNSGTQ